MKVVFILENKGEGLNLVKWMEERGTDLPVVLLMDEGKETKELIEEYPVMLLGTKNRVERVTSYVRGVHGAGMVLWTKSDWLPCAN